jgi:hypothetical protein
MASREEADNMELGEISRLVLRIIPIFLQRLPYNIEWMHFIYNTVRNIGDQPEVRPYFSEEEWQRFRIEMDNIIASLPPQLE